MLPLIIIAVALVSLESSVPDAAPVAAVISESLPAIIIICTISVYIVDEVWTAASSSRRRRRVEMIYYYLWRRFNFHVAGICFGGRQGLL